MAEIARGRPAGPVDEQDDAALALSLRDGRPAAPLAAWNRFSPLVERTLRRMLGPGGELEDLVQEVFERFFDRVAALQRPDSIRAFITGIAIRRAQEELRRRQVRRRLAHLLPAFARPRTVEPDPQSRDAIARLYRVLDSLNGDDRALYVLRYIDGEDHAGLATILAVSVPTVRRRLDRLNLRMDRLVKADPVLADYVGPLAREGSDR